MSSFSRGFSRKRFWKAFLSFERPTHLSLYHSFANPLQNVSGLLAVRPRKPIAIKIREHNSKILCHLLHFIKFITIYVPCGFTCSTLISFKVVLLALSKQTVVMFRRIDTAMAYVRHFVINKKGWTESILDKKMF